MSPIAAYYVMTATEYDRQARTPRFDVSELRPSLAERIVTALEYLVRLGRPSTVQPI